MKKFILTLCIIACGSAALRAQEVSSQTPQTAVDSIVYRAADAVDTKLQGKSIFNILTGSDNVTLSQDASVRSGMSAHIQNNSKKNITGYRVRIFFDNKQDSRGASEAALRRFQGAFPGISAYRSFTSPFFKVTVGDFRTKSEATQLLQSLKSLFPSAFIVKEQINYPVVDKKNAYVTDTVKVFKTLPATATNL